MPRQAETRRSGRKSCSVAWVNSLLEVFKLLDFLETKVYGSTYSYSWRFLNATIVLRKDVSWVNSLLIFNFQVQLNSTWHNTTVTIVCLVMLGKKGKNESGLNPRSGLKKKFFHNTIQYYCDNSLFSNVEFNPRFEFLPASIQLLRLCLQIISLLPEIFSQRHNENYWKIRGKSNLQNYWKY